MAPEQREKITSVTSFNSQSSDLASVTSEAEVTAAEGGVGTNSSPLPLPAAAVVSGRVSPSSVCFPRKMSGAIVVSAEETGHMEYLDGRPKIYFNAPHSAGCNGASLVKKKVLIPRVPSIKRACTVPIDLEEPLADFVLHPPPLRVEHWADPPATAFKVRGKNYLRDRVKINSEPSLFRLMAVDLVKVDQPIMTGMCAHPKERIQMALKREKELGVRELPEFVFAVNYCVPAEPYFHWVAYFGMDDVSVLRDPNTPLGRLAEPFFFGADDAFRNKTFKLIPRIVEGNFVVRKAVGSKPSILGSKLKQYYIRNERYFEIIVDIASDPIAEKIVKVALGAAKGLVVDMMFLLEGKTEACLPEQILAGARMQYLDFKRKDMQRRCTSPI